MATSIIGTWNVFVDWGCDGNPLQASPFTFNSDGSWTYQFGGGRWIQVEGMVAWNFSQAEGLVYTANVTRNALVGAMGYMLDDVPPTSITGCFYMLRQSGGAPAALQPSRAAAEEVGSQAASAQDIAVGPQRTAAQSAQSSSGDVAVGPQ